jgi:hypothetical protein
MVLADLRSSSQSGRATDSQRLTISYKRRGLSSDITGQLRGLGNRGRRQQGQRRFFPWRIARIQPQIKVVGHVRKEEIVTVNGEQGDATQLRLRTKGTRHRVVMETIKLALKISGLPAAPLKFPTVNREASIVGNRCFDPVPK